MTTEQAIARLTSSGVEFSEISQQVYLNTPGAHEEELEVTLKNLPFLSIDELLAFGRAVREQLLIIYQLRDGQENQQSPA